jgi:hypothetical protein
MRAILAAVIVVVGLGALGASSALASPANGAAIVKAADACARFRFAVFLAPPDHLPALASTRFPLSSAFSFWPLQPPFDPVPDAAANLIAHN